MAEIKSAITEIFGGVIRLSDVENAQHGDDFIYSVPFRFVSHETMEFVGVSRNGKDRLPASSWRVLMAEAHRLGAKHVIFRRKRKSDGRVDTRIVKVYDAADHPQPAANPVVPRHVRLVRRLLSMVGCVHFSARRDAAGDRVGE